MRPDVEPSNDVETLYFQQSARYRGRAVTQKNIFDWVHQRVKEVTPKRTIYSLLQRGEGQRLNEVWKRSLEDRVREIESSGGFSGSDAARRRFAELVRASFDRLIEECNADGAFRLAVEIAATQKANAFPQAADIVRDPKAVALIEDAPERHSLVVGVDLGNQRRLFTVGMQWAGKRILSVSPYDYLAFEVIGHEGIYATISGVALRGENAFVGQVAGKVAEATRGIAWAGRFIKGFLTAVASPAIATLDAAAKLIDMQTMAIAAFGKRTGWYEIEYSCFSSTCRQYQSCTNEQARSSSACKSELLAQAFKDASVVIPIGEAAKACYHGDAEACGNTTALFVPVFQSKASKLKPRFKENAPRGGKIGAPAERPAPNLRQSEESPGNRPRGAEPSPRGGRSGEGAKVSEAEATRSQVVHEKAKKGGSEVKLDDGTHGIAARGEGKNRDFDFCSPACSLLRDKVKSVLDVLPDKHPSRPDLVFLGKRINGVLKDLKANRIDEIGAEVLSREFSATLRTHSADPIIRQLLEMSPKEIAARAGEIKRAIRRHAEVAGEFAGRSPTPDAGRTVPAGGASTTVTRNAPGRVTGGEKLPDIKDQWFPPERAAPPRDPVTKRETRPGRDIPNTKDVRVAQIPGQIARKMRGMEFKNFAEFRQTFWKLVAADPVLSNGWSPGNLRQMRDGKPPGVISSQRVGGGSNAVYQLNHKQALKNEGGVYDLDNIEVVSPKLHGAIGD